MLVYQGRDLQVIVCGRLSICQVVVIMILNQSAASLEIW
uniref:Uncharacterized protein n=1 Tax=Arundo donax TaxID=35708 RepID=A0A0A9BVV2_ARUDO